MVITLLGVQGLPVDGQSFPRLAEQYAPVTCSYEFMGMRKCSMCNWQHAWCNCCYLLGVLSALLRIEVGWDSWLWGIGLPAAVVTPPQPHADTLKLKHRTVLQLGSLDMGDFTSYVVNNPLVVQVHPWQKSFFSV